MKKLVLFIIATCTYPLLNSTFYDAYQEFDEQCHQMCPGLVHNQDVHKACNEITNSYSQIKHEIINIQEDQSPHTLQPSIEQLFAHYTRLLNIVTLNDPEKKHELLQKALKANSLFARYVLLHPDKAARFNYASQHILNLPKEDEHQKLPEHYYDFYYSQINELENQHKALTAKEKAALDAHDNQTVLDLQFEKFELHKRFYILKAPFIHPDKRRSYVQFIIDSFTYDLSKLTKHKLLVMSALLQDQRYQNFYKDLPRFVKHFIEIKIV